MSHSQKCKQLRKKLEKERVYNGVKKDIKHFQLPTGQVIADKGRQTYQRMKKEIGR